MKTSQQGAMNPLVIVIVLVLLGAIGVWAMTMRNGAEDAMAPVNPSPAGSIMPAASAIPTASPEAMDSTDSSTLMEGETRTIEVEAGSFYFKPAEIRVKKGETVTIQLSSKDMMHDFSIDELDVKLPITKSGETNTVTFTADTAGTFEYYCSVGQHRAQGQVGTLIVE